MMWREAKMSPRGTARLRNENWVPSPLTMCTLGPELPPRTATVDRQVAWEAKLSVKVIPMAVAKRTAGDRPWLSPCPT